MPLLQLVDWKHEIDKFDFINIISKKGIQSTARAPIIIEGQKWERTARDGLLEKFSRDWTLKSI